MKTYDVVSCIGHVPGKGPVHAETVVTIAAGEDAMGVFVAEMKRDDLAKEVQVNNEAGMLTISVEFGRAVLNVSVPLDAEYLRSAAWQSHAVERPREFSPQDLYDLVLKAAAALEKPQAVTADEKNEIAAGLRAYVGGKAVGG